ncbi:DUF3644 domain-containing protein [Profundibacterium mesophilum]|uniref:DUF3644 domain-containing protein n=1 Tax=Profundibacterium mesophilum KAUST100406-0324 TaxID=1037889 RepID=A0A921NSU1_9RHOB|nr:DUF3644 domain-containing protein [Profundibacterium mesophilum]KAF0675904.1 hypothetical protein PMES_01657 [Profundibacterium mesophilum KAUST100406-0324]
MAVEKEKPKRKRRRGNTLERWEVALVKAMIGCGEYSDQDILAYFTRPTRSLNGRTIHEIHIGKKHKATKAADPEELDAFLSAWPDVDHETGLSARGDELLIKAREAMIAAVHIFNSAGLMFRAELFITTAVIAWTYLLHAYYKREGIPYVYNDKKTAHGAERYWDLSKCLSTGKCPVSEGAKNNLKFLIELRNEIEHQSTSRIDDAIGAELQSCALNFNDALKDLFGKQFGLEKRLPIALQFVSFGPEQRSAMKRASSLPTHVSSFIKAFENGLTDEQVKDPAFRLKVAFVPVAAKKAAGADMAVVTVKPGSEEAEKVGDVIFKEVNRTRYIRKDVLAAVTKAGYPGFGQGDHTKLMQELDAKNPDKGYGCQGDYKGTWVWYDRWIERVIEQCKQEGDRYR